MKTMEEAYELLAAELLEFVGEDEWDSAGSVVTVIENMTQSSYWRKRGEAVIENDRIPSLATAGPASQAVLFLRDAMLSISGDRIWGLSFTLLPSGKMTLTYDYDKPEGYEESSGTISLKDAVDRLTEMGVDVDESNLAWRQRPMIN